VLPKPPFACDLSLEQELAEFERLKPRLNEVWSTLTAQDDAPATSIVVPSLTLDGEELQKLAGSSYYEERLLFLLIRLRNPRASVVYVTSMPVHPLTLDYYLHLLAGIPASHARARLTMLCAYDASPRPLTQKILERPRLLQRLRYAVRLVLRRVGDIDLYPLQLCRRAAAAPSEFGGRHERPPQRAPVAPERESTARNSCC